MILSDLRLLKETTENSVIAAAAVVADALDPILRSSMSIWSTGSSRRPADFKNIPMELAGNYQALR